MVSVDTWLTLLFILIVLLILLLHLTYILHQTTQTISKKATDHSTEVEETKTSNLHQAQWDPKNYSGY